MEGFSSESNRTNEIQGILSDFKKTWERLQEFPSLWGPEKGRICLFPWDMPTLDQAIPTWTTPGCSFPWETTAAGCVTAAVGASIYSVLGQAGEGKAISVGWKLG